MFNNGNVNWCILGGAVLSQNGIFVVEPYILRRAIHFAVEPGISVSNKCYN